MSTENKPIETSPSDYVFIKSATALGATFNTELVEEVGLKILSEEAKRMSVSALLGPTCNIQRVRSLTEVLIMALIEQLRIHWADV